jgi:hypothetical protein
MSPGYEEDPMPYPLSYATLEEQRVELLPDRTVLSMFVRGGGGVGANGTDSTGLLGLGVPVVSQLLPNPANAQGGDGQPGAII